MTTEKLQRIKNETLSKKRSKMSRNICKSYSGKCKWKPCEIPLSDQQNFKSGNIKRLQECRASGTLNPCWDGKLLPPLLESSLTLPSKAEDTSIPWPSNSTPRYRPYKNVRITLQEIYTVFVSALFKLAKNWINSNVSHHLEKNTVVYSCNEILSTNENKKTTTTHKTNWAKKVRVKRIHIIAFI